MPGRRRHLPGTGDRQRGHRARQPRPALHEAARFGGDHRLPGRRRHYLGPATATARAGRNSASASPCTRLRGLEAIPPPDAAAYRETGDRNGEAGALNNVGLPLRQVRRFDEAITACRRPRPSTTRPATGTARP